MVVMVLMVLMVLMLGLMLVELVLILVVRLIYGSGDSVSPPDVRDRLSWFLPLYFLSLLPEPHSLSLLMFPQPLEVEEESSAVDARSSSGPTRVEMTTLWCIFT